MPFLGKEPHKDFAKLSQKYGNVFTLQLGVNNIVILNDWEAVNDALHKDSFLGRPFDTPFTLLGNVAKSFGDESGILWQEHRRFALHSMRDLGFGKGSMEDRIIDEISYLTERIDQSNAHPIDIHTFLGPSMSNNICHLVFGHRYETDHPIRSLLDKFLDQAVENVSVIGVLAMSPVWFSKTILRVGAIGNRKLFEKAFSIFDKEISSHEKNFDENIKNDYIDQYLTEMQIRKKKDPKTSFNKDTLVANCRAFFGAGSETVRTTMEWNLLLVANFSNFQKLIHKEIDEVIGNQRSPVWSDRLRMPFTQAFTNEVFRWKPILPLNLLRRAIEDSSILGHFIPKDTLILANIWAVHNDPKTWDNPNEFNPNRFLTDDGKQVIKRIDLIPFTIGKRSCVGETLARVEVFLYFTTLLQRYTISAPNDKALSLEVKFGLSLQPKDRPLLVFQKRL